MNEVIYRLAEHVINTANNKGITIATAESCTGGGIGVALTAISGSSSVFEGGIISYSNDIKINILKVPKEIIARQGAVSENTAKLMAEGARKVLHTDIAISVTGIAGPTGGTPDKPVGTIWIGIAKKGDKTKTHICEFFNMDRESVRQNTVRAALKFLIECVEDN